MSDLMSTARQIPSPVPDFLTKLEVCKILEVGEDQLDAIILAGEMPEGVPWGKKSRRWEWSDVMYFFFRRKVLARLLAPPPADETEDSATGGKRPKPARTD